MENLTNRTVELATILEFTQSRSLQNLLKNFWGLLIRNAPFRIDNYKIEIVHAIMAFVDIHFLLHYNATFTETFHNLRRFKISGKNSKQKIIFTCLVFEHWASYSKDKLQYHLNSSESLQHQNLRNLPLGVALSKWKQLFHGIQSLSIFCDAFFLLMYLLEFLNYPNLGLCLNRTLLISKVNSPMGNVAPSKNNSRGQKEGVMKAALDTSLLFCKGVLGLHTLLSYSIQFRDFWVANRRVESEQTDAWAEEFPPPPWKPEEIGAGCSLCHSLSVENPHVIEICGHVYCKTCIEKELNFYQQCPDCKLACDRRNLIKLIH